MKPILKFSTLLLAVILGLLSLGCASTDTGKCTDVNQNSIHQSLSASYDTNSDTTSASATLRFSGPTGTTLEMNGNCNIANSQYTLTKSTFLGTSYNGSGSGFKAAHSFTFTDSNNKSYTNSATIPTVAFSGTPPATASKAAGVTVNFTPALAAGEIVQLLISSTTGTGTVVASTSTAGATSVTATSTDFDHITTGAAQMYVQKSHTTTATDITSAGGAFTVSYSSNRPTITISN